jgi:hypothetical protein
MCSSSCSSAHSTPAAPSAWPQGQACHGRRQQHQEPSLHALALAFTAEAWHRLGLQVLLLG